MPKRQYRQKTTGKAVKGVTTINNILSKPALLPWAYKQGMNNFERLMIDISYLSQATLPTVEDYKALLEGLIKDFKITPLYEKRDKAADAGTLAHLFIEKHLKGLPEPSREGLTQEVIDKAEGCYLTFLDWERANIKKVIGSEIEITSEEYPYGGTIDHVIIGPMTPKGMVDILDIKTGKDIYLEAKLQVRAYKPLWEETHQVKSEELRQEVAGFHILRLGENGEFTHKYFPSLDEKYFEIFLSCLNIIENLSILGEKI